MPARLKNGKELKVIVNMNCKAKTFFQRVTQYNENYIEETETESTSYVSVHI